MLEKGQRRTFVFVTVQVSRIEEVGRYGAATTWLVQVKRISERGISMLGKVDSESMVIDPHAHGAKLDQGKARVDLVLGSFARSLLEVAKVGTHGATKYSPNGWMSVDDAINRYSDAMMRHYLKEKLEGPVDLDEFEEHGVKLLHAAQLAWNALARLHFIVESLQTPKKG